MATEINIIPCTELKWSMGGGYQGRPQLPMSYSTCSMDPFPAYPHDFNYTLERAMKTYASFPVPFPVDFWIPSFESDERFNGCCWVEHDYDGPEKRDAKTNYKVQPVKKAHIVLSGKRIPPMKIMTEYLVAHEYGHAVEDHIAYEMGMYDDTFKDMYRDLRGVVDNKKGYVGRNWHLSIGEIFANDFRVLICGAALDFWPHECKRPEEDYAVIGFWEQARQYMYKPVVNAQSIDVFETKVDERPREWAGPVS